MLFAVVIHFKSAFMAVIDDSGPLLNLDLGRGKFRVHIESLCLLRKVCCTRFTLTNIILKVKKKGSRRIIYHVR